MNNIFKKIEAIILISLWVLSITTYSLALFNNYNLFSSDYFGLLGLVICSIIAFKKPQILFNSILLLLFFGLFNLVSFAYFFNVVFSFGISSFISPGIQIISLIFLSILIFIKREKFISSVRFIFQKNEEEKSRSADSLKIQFKKKFELLTNEEIEIKLKQNLTKEATKALQEIKEERKK